jgi:hypothetical protein
LVLLFFMSLICSLYLVLNGRPVCPVYFIGQLMHFIWYTPSMQRYYRRFFTFIIHLTATCLGRTTTFRQTCIY